MKIKITALCAAVLLASVSTTMAQKKKSKNLDADNDGKVSLSEYLAVRAAATKSKAKKKGLSEAEMTELWNKTSKKAKKTFDAADANNDGELDSAEQASLPTKKKKKKN